MDEDANICTYRVRAGHEAQFRSLIEKHWSTLRNHDLVTGEPPQVFSGKDEGGVFFVELFSWVDKNSVQAAHDTPEVMTIWESMGDLVEGRLGRPGMEFLHMKKLGIPFTPRVSQGPGETLAKFTNDWNSE